MGIWNLKSKQKLSDVIQVNPRRQLKKGGIAPFVAMENITPYEKIISKYTQRKVSGSNTKFQNGDTLLAKITPSLENGKTAFVDFLKENEIGHGSTEFIVLCGKENQTLDQFVYYLMRMPEFREEAIRSMTGTSGRQRVQETVFDDYYITLLSLPVQEKISKTLNDLDNKIKNLQNQNHNLEQIAQAIFKSWFVDFDGVTEFEDSELGKIPKGWSLGNISDIIEINPTRNLKKGTIAPYLGMTDIPTHSSRISGFYLREFTSGMKFINGDTLVARITPSLENGKTAFVDFLQNDEIGWGSTEYIVLRPKVPIPAEYGYCFARTDDFRSHAILNMTGTSGRQRVPESCFDEYSVVKPPTDLTTVFGNITKKIFLKIKNNANRIDGLTKTRDALLPKLMSGEMRV
jgi:type I restriction enzyme, S subunit